MEDKELKKILLSIENFFEKENLKDFFSSFKFTNHDFSLDRDVIQQIFFVIISIGVGDENYFKGHILESHYIAAKVVVISHIIDDIVDVPNEYLRSDFIRSIQSLDKDNVEEIYEELVDLCFRRVDDLEFRKNLSSELTEHVISLNSSLSKKIFKISMCRMILAGIIQTSNNLEESNKLSSKYLELAKLLNINKSTNTQTYSLNKYPIDIYISEASSLQEMFASVEDTFDLNIVELSNCILGPLVFLNNLQNERKNYNILSLVNNAKANEYEQFIKSSWEYFKLNYLINNLLLNNNLRLVQIVLACKIFHQRTSNHNYSNFPGELVNLDQVYDMIYLEGVQYLKIEFRMYLEGVIQSLVNL